MSNKCKYMMSDDAELGTIKRDWYEIDGQMYGVQFAPAPETDTEESGITILDSDGVKIHEVHRIAAIRAAIIEHCQGCC